MPKILQKATVRPIWWWIPDQGSVNAEDSCQLH